MEAVGGGCRMLLLVLLLYGGLLTDRLEGASNSASTPAGRASTQAYESRGEVKDAFRPQVGHSIDIMPRFGYFALSMKVVAHNETGTQAWIFREPTVDVFQNIGPYVQNEAQGKQRHLFNGDFHMEFCDNLKQLMQAYFRDFKFEEVEKSWRAFTGSWSASTVAKHMGINTSYVDGEYCYVLVRLFRVRESMKLTNLPTNVNLSEMVARDVANVKLGDEISVLNFTRRIGSHYIHSFVTGNSLYQVFVYKRATYTRIRKRLESRGISQISNTELSNYFSPWYAEHIGKIKTASGNATVEAWAENKLRVLYYVFAYPSLMKIYGDSKLVSALNTLLVNEALLEIDMRTLAPVFKDPVKKRWFNEVLVNFLRLLEENS